MKKVEKNQHWFEVDAPYRLLTYNLFNMKEIVYDASTGIKKHLSKQGFTFEIDVPGLEGIRFQLTRRNKLGIFAPIGVEIDRIVEKTKPFLDKAAGYAVRLTPLPIKEKIGSMRARSQLRGQATLRHSQQLIVGLEAILAEDWVLYRSDEPSKERAQWREKIERDGIRLKPFAIEHLRNGYPVTYDKMMRWRKLKERAKKALLNEGFSAREAEAAMNYASFF